MKSLLLPLVIVASLLAPTAAVAADPGGSGGEASEQAETVEAVDVKLRIREGKAKVGELAGLVAFDEAAQLEMKVDGHHHVASVTVRKADDQGKKLAIVLGYQRDGKAVLEQVTVDAKAAKKKVVKSADGKIAIAVTLAPKQVSPDQLPPKKKQHHKIQLPVDRTDPLAGL